MARITDLEAGRLSWRERRLEEWLAALPLADPATALQRMVVSLRALNAATIEPSRRVALLARYEKTVNDLSAVVRRPGEGIRRIPLMTSVVSELAHGYETALGSGLKSELEERAIRGAIINLAEVVRSAYRSYVPVPPGLWRRIHGLYKRADDSDAGAAVEAAYKEILLLGLSNPYALPVGTLDLVTSWITANTRFAELHAERGFRIEPGSDVPAILKRGTVDVYRLETRGLVAEVRRLRTILQARNNLPPAWAGAITPEVADRLLAILADAWLPVPKARAPRVRISGERHVCQGFAALYTAAREDRRSNSYVDLDASLHYHYEKPALPLTTWRVRDAGRGGLWLAGEGPEFLKRAPRPGFLVGICDPKTHGPWKAAVVRWLRRVRPREHAIGVEILGAAESVVVSQEGGAPFAALLIHPAQNEPLTLLAPAGRIVIGRNLRMRMNRQEMVRAPVVRLDQVGGLDRFALAGGLDAGKLVQKGAHQRVDTRVGGQDSAAL